MPSRRCPFRNLRDVYKRQLYEYFNYQIIQANVRKNPETVNEILPMIEELKEAFAQADKQVRIGHTG